MIEKLFFNLVATALFIIIFFIMARKNNTTYISLLVIEAIGIAINFLEINFNIFVQWPFKVIEYIFSIILPIIILFLERKKIIKFPEIIALIMNKYYIAIKDDEKNKFSNCWRNWTCWANIFESFGRKKYYDKKPISFCIKEKRRKNYQI